MFYHIIYKYSNCWANIFLRDILAKEFASSAHGCYEKLENIKPENHDKLLADLRERTGLDIQQFEIRRINFLRDTFRIRIYCKEQNE